MAIYKNGKLTKEYKVLDLVKDASKLLHTSAGLWWLEHGPHVSPTFKSNEGVDQLIAMDRIRYVCDINTAEIKSSSIEPPRKDSLT